MSTHYNAFISYRHAPRDMKVAEAIQKDLESFHIPKKFRDEAGTKSFHIFRDKNELGTASDLSTEIANALDNSDFLIVICSNSVKESIWVTREISYFLQHHPRSHVLTVLAEGEPEEIIPDIITREERIMQDERGNYYTTTVPLEPLSCDYRLPHGKAKKIELPRLTSALLHCSYDDLMNRKRKARVRNITLGFSAALILMGALGVYMLLSKQKIQKNLEASLRNQSIYLANAAQQQLEEQERILAMQLALAALPKDEEDDRPVTPEAVRALTDATLAYRSSTSGDIHDVWNYAMSDIVKDFQISATGSQLAGLDNSGHVIVWDTATHKVLMTPVMGNKPFTGMTFLDNNTLILRKEGTIYAYDPETGNELWSYSAPADDFFRNADMYVDQGNGGDEIFLVTMSNKLLRIDGKTGKVSKEYQLPEKDGEDDISITKIMLSPSKDKVAFTGFAGYYGDMYFLGICDLSSGAVVKTPRGDRRYSDFYWASDSRIFTAVPQADEGYSSSSVGSVSYIKTDHTLVQCMDAATLSVVWEYDFTTTDVMYKSGFYSMLDGEKIAYYSANRSVIFDPADGTVIRNHIMNDPIIDMQDVNGNGRPFYITRDGSIVTSASNSDLLSVTPTLNSNLKGAKIYRGIYTRTSMGTQIYFFGVDVWDNDWTPVPNGPEITGVSATAYTDSSVLAVLSKEKVEEVKGTVRGLEEYEGEVEILTLIRPLDNKMIDRIILTEKDAERQQFQVLGSSAGHFYMSADSVDKGLRLFDVDIATGENRYIQLSKNYVGTKKGSDLRGGKYIYMDEDENFLIHINLYDTATGETASRIISEDVSTMSMTSNPVYIEANNSVYLPGYDQDFLISFDDLTKPAESPARDSDWNKTKYVAYDYKSGRYAISDLETIIVLNADLTEAFRIPCTSAAPVGISFFASDKKNEPSILLVPSENFSLYRYNGETGEFLGRTKFSYSASGMEPDFIFSLDQKILYFYMGSSLSIIDTETWVETAFIRNCIGYAPVVNKIYASGYSSSGGINIGYFPYYTVDDLIKKAEDLLAGAEMSDEVKSEYGLDEN